MKRIIALFLIFIITIGVVTVSASPPPGTQGNPLISRSHLEGAFAESLRSDITASLEGAMSAAMSGLEVLYLSALGYQFARRFSPVSVASGETIAIGPGSSFILTSGTASLSVSSGAVINITTGQVAVTGTNLIANQRYFTTEGAFAIITASAAASGLVDGFFNTDGTAAPPPPPPPPPPGQTGTLPFTDVPASAWFYNAVEFVFRNNIFSGTTPTTFSPNTPMTRGMFVTVLHRLDGLPDSTAASMFSDVRNPSAFYYDAVVWANANGIVTGFADGTFRPNDSVTREQMAAIMHRYAEFRGLDVSAGGSVFDMFPDAVNVSGFAAEAMRWAVSREIIRGSGGMLNPRNTATRAEVAQIILNYTTAMGTH